MGRTSLITFTLPLALLAFAACSDGDNPDAGGGDSGTPPDMGGFPDAAGFPDAEPAETGPKPCYQDQIGEANDGRGCEPGFVCNLAMDPPACVAGRACTSDTDCNPCSDLVNPQDCGHGYNVVAFCDERHAAAGTGGTCTRSRAPCEPCDVDDDCGRLAPLSGGGLAQCLDYPGGKKFCGRACGRCPMGFTCTDAQCKREECSDEPDFCPPDDMMGASCTNAGQLCVGEECPGTGGGLCATNDLPGLLGTCIGFCQNDDDCMGTPATPVCNTGNGLCIAGCTKDSCAAGQTCHLDGFCGMPCEDNAACVTRFGDQSYCNESPGMPPDRIFKGYHDAASCQKLGCEEKVDCPSAGLVCDSAQVPPRCVPGCFENSDCSTDFCRSTSGQLPRPSYSQSECRALAPKTDPNEIGVCCDPGCLDRELDCAKLNSFCCGESGSPYEDPLTCLAETSTGGPQAAPGDCFEMPAPDPWCHQCMEDADCNSGYTPGYNVDPNVNGGQPFEEQEFCVGVAQNPVSGDVVALCNVTCNPTNLDDNQCPRGWVCSPMYPGCLQDADCNGLECVGENLGDPNDPMDDVQGKCKCGEAGTMSASCPQAYAGLASAVENPRCVDYRNTGGDMLCVASYVCNPTQPRFDAAGNVTNYPQACGL